MKIDLNELEKLAKIGNQINFHYRIAVQLKTECYTTILELIRQIKVMREALEHYANHESIIVEAYHSNDEKQITCVHGFINATAKNALQIVDQNKGEK